MESKEPRSIQSRRVIGLRVITVLAGVLLGALLYMSPRTAPARADFPLTSQNGSPGAARVDMSEVALLAAYDSSHQPDVVAGSTFTFAMAYDAVGLDPALVTDFGSLMVTSQVYETMVNIEPGGTIPEPGLSESWSVSPDGLTWTFNLRSGVKFHDGTDLNAAAVLYNLDRWWDPAHPYHDGSFGYFGFLFGGFKGDADCLIGGLGTIGTNQVQIVLSEPLSPLPSILAMPFFAIASPTAIEAGTLTTIPVGTGAFKFVEWVPGDHIRLTGNTTYWGEGPYLETLTFQVIASDADRFAALQSNAVQGIGDVAPSYVLTATLDANLKVLWRPAFNTGYLGINREHSPLDDLLVRQAIAHAIDKQSIVDNHYNAEGEVGQVAEQLLPPVLWGYDRGFADYTYDPAQARSLLAQAGYTNGFTTTLWVMPMARLYFPRPADIAASMQADLQTVGITATLVTYYWADYFDKIFSGEADLFMLGWYGDYIHPDNFFYPVLCDGYQAYGPLDDTLCNQLQAAREEPDFDTQVGMYEWASQRVHDTLPLVPIGHARTPLIVRRNVAGLVPAAIPESFKGVFFASSWVYMPLVLKSCGP